MKKQIIFSLGLLSFNSLFAQAPMSEYWKRQKTRAADTKAEKTLSGLANDEALKINLCELGAGTCEGLFGKDAAFKLDISVLRSAFATGLQLDRIEQINAPYVEAYKAAGKLKTIDLPDVTSGTKYDFSKLSSADREVFISGKDINEALAKIGEINGYRGSDSEARILRLTLRHTQGGGSVKNQKIIERDLILPATDMSSRAMKRVVADKNYKPILITRSEKTWSNTDLQSGTNKGTQASITLKTSVVKSNSSVNANNLKSPTVLPSAVNTNKVNRISGVTQAVTALAPQRYTSGISDSDAILINVNELSSGADDTLWGKPEFNLRFAIRYFASAEDRANNKYVSKYLQQNRIAELDTGASQKYKANEKQMRLSAKLVNDELDKLVKIEAKDKTPEDGYAILVVVFSTPDTEFKPKEYELPVSAGAIKNWQAHKTKVPENLPIAIGEKESSQAFFYIKKNKDGTLGRQTDSPSLHYDIKIEKDGASKIPPRPVFDKFKFERPQAKNSESFGTQKVFHSAASDDVIRNDGKALCLYGESC